MVNSKKMSKSSVTVIVLSILLVLSMLLGLTGAWFTREASDETTGLGDLVMGSLGEVTITAEAAVWTKADSDADRTVVMPGDTVTCGSVSIAYSNAGTEDEVFYLISDGAKYYTIEGGALVEATANAGTIAKGASVATAADYATVNGKDVNANGADFEKADEGVDVELAAGFSNDGATYTVKVIQGANMDAATAFGLLK